MWQWRQRSGWCCHKPRSAESPQKLEEVRKDPPLETSKDHGPANALIADF